ARLQERGVAQRPGEGRAACCDQCAISRANKNAFSTLCEAELRGNAFPSGAWERGECGAWERGECGAWERGECGAWERGECGAWERGEMTRKLQQNSKHQCGLTPFLLIIFACR